MKAYLQSFLAVLIMCLSLSTFANPCDDGGIGGSGSDLSKGIGGTGIESGDKGVSGSGAYTANGIGGTGITSEDAGVGGTGEQAKNGIGGTGIVGVITGFGSICVNGIEVHYYNDTPVQLDGEKINSSKLAVGHVVAVKASGNGQSIVAQEINVFHQITGPITDININRGELKVMGQKVSIASSQLKGLKVGQWLNVSGLRKGDGSVLASRLDLSQARGTAQAIGNLTQQGNKLYLNGTKVKGLAKASLNSNTEVRLTGTWDGKALNVRDAVPGPVSDLINKVEILHLQGVKEINNGKGHVMVGNQQVPVPEKLKVIDNSQGKGLTEKTVIVHGQVKTGKVTVQSIEIRPMNIENKKQHDSHAIPLMRNNLKKSEERSLSQDKKPLNSRDSRDAFKKDQPEKIESSDRAETPDKIEKPDEVGKPDLVNKPERIQDFERPEKIEKIERIEKIEKPEKIERIEKIEKPERIDRVEKIERVEKIQIEKTEMHH